MSEPQTYEEYMARAAELAKQVDKALIACRPAQPTPQERAMAAEVGMDIDTPYDGSARGACALCDREVWIGPRSQDMLVQSPDKATVTCLLCATAVQLLMGPESIPVVSLGSEHPTDRPHG